LEEKSDIFKDVCFPFKLGECQDHARAKLW